MVEVVIGAIVFALIWVGFRKLNPFQMGWQKSALCKRCGYVNQGWDTQVWGSDKTCPRCGPNSKWERVVSRVHPFWGHDIAENAKDDKEPDHG